MNVYELFSIIIQAQAVCKLQHLTPLLKKSVPESFEIQRQEIAPVLDIDRHVQTNA